MAFGKEYYKPVQQSITPELPIAKGEAMFLLAELLDCSQE